MTYPRQSWLEAPASEYSIEGGPGQPQKNELDPKVSDLVRAKSEIRAGNNDVAEPILNAILEDPGEITTDILLELTVAYEQICVTANRYEDLISIARKCSEKAHSLPAVDFEIHKANCLAVIADAEMMLGRRDEAGRHIQTAQAVLNRFPPEHFRARSREKVNKIWLRLKSLQRAVEEGSFQARDRVRNSRGPISSGGTPEWRAFVSQKNISTKSLKDVFAKMRQTGSAPMAEILVQWAMDVPRAGNIGTNAGLFAILVEMLFTLTAQHTLATGTQQKLLRIIRHWENEQQWLQKLIVQNRKLTLGDKLQCLRKALEVQLWEALDSVEREMAALERLGGAEILDGGHDHEARLLRLDAQLQELNNGVSASFVPCLNALRERLDAVVAKIDAEIHRRNNIYEQVLAAVEEAADRSALTVLKVAVKQLPPAMQTRPELEQAFSKTSDRLLAAEVEALERRERAEHLAKLSSVQGVNLASLLFQEYGIDVPAARQLVIDYNKGQIDREGLLDRVFEIRRAVAPANDNLTVARLVPRSPVAFLVSED